MARTIARANKALNAISLIRRYFTQEGLIKLITSNFYSVLYYNSEVWQIPTLNQSLKNYLLTASSRALKLFANRMTYVWMLSFKNLHEMAGCATPEKLTSNKLALQGLILPTKKSEKFPEFGSDF